MRALVLALMSAVFLAGACRADPVSDRIYPAPREALSTAGLAAGTVMITVATADGLSLKGLEVPARPGMPTLLAFHGNGSSAADTIEWFAPAIAQGYGVVAAEYRGYSGNPGRPSERGLAADADAFMIRARQAAGGGPVWIVGHSLGGGVALSLARRTPTEAVITIGTFTRLRDMVDGLARAVVPDAYRNIDAVPELTLPYYLVHGAADPVVPASQGQTLYRLAAAAKRDGGAFVIQDADHYPSGDVMLSILDAIRRRPAGDLSINGLSGTVRWIPFGAGQP